MAKNDSLIDEDPEPSRTGHNSLAIPELKKLMDQIETLHNEKKIISEDIKAAFEVVKSKGFDVRTVREALKLRAIDIEKRREREELRDLYLSALGLID